MNVGSVMMFRGGKFEGPADVPGALQHRYGPNWITPAYMDKYVLYFDPLLPIYICIYVNTVAFLSRGLLFEEPLKWITVIPLFRVVEVLTWWRITSHMPSCLGC